MTKRVVLISSGQPSLNPRLVKEADALYQKGYDVIVLYQYWNLWGTEKDIRLLNNRKWKGIRIGGKPGDWIYLLSRIIFKLGRETAKRVGFGFGMAELSIARGAWLLARTAKVYKADLYIAHNIGALPAAVKAAGKYQSLCGFDAEDFHRYETSNDDESFDVKVKSYIEEKYIPKLNYLTTASPLISEAYKSLFPSVDPLTILNVFPLEKNIKVKQQGNRLKLFWFSQTIGEHRGIESIISAMAGFPEKLELHLLGHHDENIKAVFRLHALSAKAEAEQIFYYNPIDPDQIIMFASQFDIGIAAELKTPENRNICLTNKIFTYIQAGLAVLASDTKAQSALFKKYPAIGKQYCDNDPDSVSRAIRFYIDNPEILVRTRKNNLELGQTELNWETEKNDFLDLIQSVLADERLKK